MWQIFIIIGALIEATFRGLLMGEAAFLSRRSEGSSFQLLSRSGLELERLQEGSVLVIGDVMLDTFVYGEVSRISPEAPIPVLSVVEERSTAGGAANVALNVAGLGAHAVLIGIIGNDQPGRLLRELVTTSRLPARLELVVDSNRPTTVKTRYIGNNQQIMRLDCESTVAASVDIEDAIISRVIDCLPSARMVAVSDYAKGTLTDRVISETIALCRRAGVPLIVDPKRVRWGTYRGADYIKPNLRELATATGLPCRNDDEIDRAAAQIVSELDTRLLLTQSQRGMSLYSPDSKPIHSRAVRRDVFDVSGAGDTALAAFSAALASGFDLSEALTLANVAAGVAVTKLGTSVVYAEELANAWAKDHVRDFFDRAVTRSEAAIICSQWRSRGLRVGFTNGCFDILHIGHVTLLSKAASMCDRLVVGINSDASVRRLKGQGRPVLPESSRVQVVAALHGASLVTVFDEDTPLTLIELLKPTILFKGADYREDTVVGGDLVKTWDGKVVLIELVPNISTTSAIRSAQCLG